MTTENIELKLAQLTEPLNIDELTTGAVDGTGVFDVLMRVGKAHIKEEFDKQRITGKEYATAYLGMMQSTQANAIDYLLKNKTIGAEILNLEKDGEYKDAQVALTKVQVQDATASLAKTPIEVDILKKQLLIADADNALKLAQVDQLQKEVTKIPYEISILEKQAIQVETQGLLTNAQKEQVLYETANKLPVEVTNLQKQSEQLDAQLEMTEAQVTKILEENKIIPYQISKLQAEIANMTRQSDILEKELEIKVLGIALQDKQILLATAELDIRKQELEVKKAEVESTKAQADLYAAKVLTENAQTQPTAAAGSVLGANVAVLNAQADGYKRDAEQKLTKILVDTWNVRRNTDDLTDANGVNCLSDANIGTAVQALFKGVGITTK